jgi:hypothetical protein
MNFKLSDFLYCSHLFFDYVETEAPLVSTVYFAELRGPFYTSQMEALCGDLGSGRPSVNYYQQPNTLADFHKISYKSPLQNVVKPD